MPDGSQTLKHGRMQAVGQYTQVGAEFRGIIPKFTKALTRLCIELPNVVGDGSKINDKHRQPLTVVIMDLARDPPAFFLLRLDQSPAEARQGFFCLLTIGDVHRHAEHTHCVAMTCVVELSPGSYPAHGSIGSHDAEF